MNSGPVFTIKELFVPDDKGLIVDGGSLAD